MRGLLRERECPQLPDRLLRREPSPALGRLPRSARTLLLARGMFEGCARIALAHVRCRHLLGNAGVMLRTMHRPPCAPP